MKKIQALIILLFVGISAFGQTVNFPGTMQRTVDGSGFKFKFVGGLGTFAITDSIRAAGSGSYTPGYGMSLVGQQFRVDTTLIATKSILNNYLLYVTPEQYGAVGDGIADDRAAIVTALSHSKNVFLSRKYYVSAPIPLLNGVTIKGGGNKSVIYTKGNYEVFTITGSNISVSDLKIVGTGRGSSTNYVTTRPNQNGIVATGDVSLGTNYNNILISGILADSLGGSMFYGSYLVGSEYQGGVKISNSLVTNSYAGIFFDTRSEYNTLDGVYAFNNQYGAIVAGGNNAIVGGQYNGNRTGLSIIAGSNNAHGIVSAATINHNFDYGVMTDGVTLGQTFNNCNIYQNNLLIRNSDKIRFDGCNLEITQMYIQTSTNTSFINNSIAVTSINDRWNGSSNTGTLSPIRWFNNDFSTGMPGNYYNDISLLRVGVEQAYSYGTKNSIPYVNIDGIVKIDSSKLYYDGTRLGVNEPNPDVTTVFKDGVAKLRIESTSGNGTELYFGNTSDKYSGYLSHNNTSKVLTVGSTNGLNLVGGTKVANLAGTGDRPVFAAADGTLKIGTSSAYTLPIASSTVLGGFKVGTGLSIDGTGILSATGGGSQTFQQVLTAGATATVEPVIQRNGSNLTLGLSGGGGANGFTIRGTGRDWYHFVQTNGNYTFGANQGDKYFFTNDGKLGINQSTPAVELDVVGVARSTVNDNNPNTLVRNKDLNRINFIASGTGSATTISLPHSLTGVNSSSFAIVQAKNAASSGISYVTTDATNINIVYSVAPPAGTNNLYYSIELRP